MTLERKRATFAGCVKTGSRSLYQSESAKGIQFAQVIFRRGSQQDVDWSDMSHQILKAVKAILMETKAIFYSRKLKP